METSLDVKNPIWLVIIKCAMCGDLLRLSPSVYNTVGRSYLIAFHSISRFSNYLHTFV